MDDPVLEENPTSQKGYIRRLEQQNRFLSVFAGIAVAGILGTFSGIIALFPLKKTETIFVSLPKGEHQLVRLLPDEVDRGTREQWMRATLFEYIVKRETINFVDEDIRYAWLKSFTHPEWYRLFANQMSYTNKESPLNYYSENDLTREIHVQSIESIPDSNNIWRAEFIATDRKSGQRLQQRNFIATFKAYLTVVQMDSEIAKINPFGLIIENYAIQEKGIK